MAVRIQGLSRCAGAALMGCTFILAAGPAVTAERVQEGTLVMEGIPEVPEALRERLRQYQNTRGAGFSDWAPDGESILIGTRFGETAQLHKVDRPMGARQQLTFYDEPVGGGAYRPVEGSREILFGRDEGGDENSQVFVFDEATGTATLYSDGSQRKGGAIWSSDGDKIAWFTTIEASPNWGIVVADHGDPASRRMVYEGTGAWFPGDWSPDGTQLALQKYISNVESEIYLLDVARGEVTQINPSDAKISYGGVGFAPDGKSVYFASNEHGAFMDMIRYNLETGEQTILTKDIDWDVEGGDMSDDGQYYAFTVNAGGRSELHIRRTKNDRDIKGPDLPPGLVYNPNFSPDGTKLGFTFNSATSPSDAWVWDIKEQKLTRWTRSEVGGLDTDNFADAEFFDYPTFDGRQIPAFIYKPDGEGPHPVVIDIHGGPEAQARPGFSSTTQHWVNDLGLAVIEPNVRGSRGYGTEYLNLDNGMKREDSVKDIGALLDWIAAQPDLDENRVMVYGGSYGGYMVLASMVHYNDRLAGGVDIVGISDFITFLENTSDYRRDLRRAEYGDERDPEMRAFFERIAPANQADKITKPLFIIQGANDPRVPASEAEQILAEMKANGAEPWFLMAMDEGHGFRKKSNRDFMREAVALFFQAYLLDE